MASDTQNCLQFEGNQKEINRLLRAIQGTDPDLQPIDFTKIIPMPTELEIDAGSQTEAGLDAFREFVRTTGGNKQHEKEYLSRHGDIDREAWKLGKQAFRNIQQYGCPTWREWCVQHWNTALNAQEGSLEDGQLFFLSSGEPPFPIIQELSRRFPSVTIQYSWAGESIGEDCGERIYQNGAMVKETSLTEDEAVELASDLWGLDPQDYRETEDEWMQME